MATKPKQTFELQGRSFFFTYPRCSLTPEEALEQLSKEFAINEYIVARELHQDGVPHLHVYFKTAKRTKVYSTLKMELKKEQTTFKGNYQLCKNSFLVQKYCKKDGDYITNMKFNLLAQALASAKAGDIDAAFDQVAEARPDMILSSGQRVKANLQMLADDNKEQDHTYSDFINIPALMAEWNREKQVLWLFGATGLGKTEYARSLFNNPLFVRHKDQLKGLTTKTDGIIFDDFSITHWPRESVIHLTDLNNKSGIDVKHGVAVIPKGMPRIFCSNTWIWPEDESGAIQRRVYAIKITRKLFKEQKNDQVQAKQDDWDSIKNDAPCGQYGFQYHKD